MKRRVLSVVLCAGLAAPALACAQAYPSKPVRLIVPFAPGGTTGIVARIVSEKMGVTLGQTEVVENRDDGGGDLQTELSKSLAGVFMTHIPYRGAGPALNDTVAGQVQIVFDNRPSALPFIKSGRLLPIVVAAQKLRLD